MLRDNDEIATLLGVARMYESAAYVKGKNA
jgi:hypothetical protein